MTTWNPTGYDPDDFANRRHIGPSPAEMTKMLVAVGVASLDELIDQANEEIGRASCRERV